MDDVDLPEVHIWPKVRGGRRGMLIAVQGEGVIFAPCDVEGLAYDLVEALVYRKYVVYVDMDAVEDFYRRDREEFVDDGTEG